MRTTSIARTHLPSGMIFHSHDQPFVCYDKPFLKAHRAKQPEAAQIKETQRRLDKIESLKCPLMLLGPVVSLIDSRRCFPESESALW